MKEFEELWFANLSKAELILARQSLKLLLECERIHGFRAGYDKAIDTIKIVKKL
jgi:hypothetical protein